MVGNSEVSERAGPSFRLARHTSEIGPTLLRDFQFRIAVSSGCLLNLPHWFLERSSGGSQHHESSSEQEHELQAPRYQESCNREGDGSYSEGGQHEHARNSPAHRDIDPETSRSV
jgi:hypothetical protein